jgi:hypothetical protein
MRDLRTPIGLFFGIIGFILVVVGVVDPGARADLTQVNVNLYCGFSMVLFGSVMLWLARRSS